MPDLSRDEHDDMAFPMSTAMLLPPPGTRVRVTMRNFTPNMYAFTTARVIGNVVNKPFWAEPDTLAMWTGKELRIIARWLLHSINGERVSQATRYEAPRPQVWRVKGSKGDVYNVVLDEYGAWTCSCAGFTFRHKCRHIDETRAKL